MIRMKLAVVAAVALAGMNVSLGAASRPTPTPHAVAPKGSHFDAIGRITMHAGQPCTSQIMFDFRGKTVIWLAAPKRESAILTDAARHKQRVHVTGIWRQGATSACAFVEVTHAAPEKKFLGIF